MIWDWMGKEWKLKMHIMDIIGICIINNRLGLKANFGRLKLIMEMEFFIILKLVMSLSAHVE